MPAYGGSEGKKYLAWAMLNQSYQSFLKEIKWSKTKSPQNALWL